MAIANRQERYEAEHEKLTLYRMGMTDAQIAAALDLSVATIQAWRRREGLAPNRAPKRSGAAQPAPANHPWRDRMRQRQDPKRPAGVPTVDAVTQAAATCDAMTALSASQATDFPVMFRVEIPTGRILVDRRPWWLRRASDNARVGC